MITKPQLLSRQRNWWILRIRGAIRLVHDLPYLADEERQQLISKLEETERRLRLAHKRS